MSNIVRITEGELEFTFRVDRLIKWDDDSGYRKGIQKLQNTGAVDFVAEITSGTAALVEVKDFRSHRIENKDRLSSGELALEVAEKVRDTFAGMMWACGRNIADHTALSNVTGAIANRADKLRVILWLEEDVAAPPAVATALAGKVREHLRPHIVAKVTVTSRSLEKATSTPLDWVSAKQRT